MCGGVWRPQGQCRMSSSTGRAIRPEQPTGRGVNFGPSGAVLKCRQELLSFLCGCWTKWLHGRQSGFYAVSAATLELEGAAVGPTLQHRTAETQNVPRTSGRGGLAERLQTAAQTLSRYNLCHAGLGAQAFLSFFIFSV